MAAIIWSKEIDLYANLYLRHDATQADIKQAYHRLELIHHPDKRQPGKALVDAGPFLKVREAYKTLSDPASRRSYDAFIGYRAPISNAKWQRKAWNPQYTDPEAVGNQREPRPRQVYSTFHYEFRITGARWGEKDAQQDDAEWSQAIERLQQQVSKDRDDQRVREAREAELKRAERQQREQEVCVERGRQLHVKEALEKALEQEIISRERVLDIAAHELGRMEVRRARREEHVELVKRQQKAQKAQHQMLKKKSQERGRKLKYAESKQMRKNLEQNPAATQAAEARQRKNKVKSAARKRRRRQERKEKAGARVRATSSLTLAG